VFTSEQASAGEQQFQQNCESCHTVSEHTGRAFTDKWAGTTLNELFELISNTMPENEPGRLKPEEYASIVAFFLEETGYPAARRGLPSEVAALTKIRVELLAR
jgi:mono/diheme cytochrome c family protein